jgi:hypothetical protein
MKERDLIEKAGLNTLIYALKHTIPSMILLTPGKLLPIGIKYLIRILPKA